MNWKDLRISKKLTLVFILVLGLMAGLGIFSFYGVGRVEGRAVASLRINDLKAELITREVDHLKWASKVATFVSDAGATELDVQMDPKQCKLGKWYYSAERTRTEEMLPQLKTLLAGIESHHNALHASAREIQELRRRGQNEEAAKLYKSATLASLGGVQKILNEMVGISTAQAEAEEKDFTATSARTRMLVIILVALAVPLCALAGFLLSRSVSRPAREGVDFAEKLTAGDLTARIELDRKDEIGALCGALNRMSTNLREIVGSMHGDMSRLAANSEQVRAVALGMRTSVETSAKRSASVSEAVRQISTNMTSASAAVEQTNSNVSMVAAAAEELTATISEIAQRAAEARKIADEAVATAKRTSVTVDELSNAAAEIGKVTQTISDISEQTKLLALNATIEAARAGDAGKGFAVVASEIKELARQVAEATGDIAKRIDAIRASSDETRVDIGRMGEVINEVNQTILTIASAVEEQSATVGEIARNAQEVSSAMNDASRLVSETSVATTEVAEEVDGLHGESKQLSDESVHLDASSGELRRVAEQMQALCGRFKV